MALFEYLQVSQSRTQVGLAGQRQENSGDINLFVFFNWLFLSKRN